MIQLTATGLEIDTQQQIRDRINARMIGAFGSGLDVTDESLIGQFIGIISDELASIQEVIQAVNASQDPDGAQGVQLDGILALTGTIRELAQSSIAILTLTGVPATVVASGSRGSVTGTGENFSTIAAATIATVAAWAPSTSYAIGDRVHNLNNVYRASGAGTSAGAGGPTGTGTGIADNTVTWDFLGPGTGAVDVVGNSVNTGPIPAVARSIVTIETPIAGWNGVINVLDATLGQNRESDEEARIRRVVELFAAAGGSLPGLRTALLAVTGVTAVRLFQNVTSAVDAEGLPPKSVEAVVEGGADQDIFDALFANVCGGMETHGNVAGTVTDSEGTAQPYEFSRFTSREIYVIVNLIKDSTYPANGDDQVEAQIANQPRVSGLNVVSSRLASLAHDVTGVLEVPSVLIGLSDPPTLETTIPIALREVADYDTSRITVNATDGTP